MVTANKIKAHKKNKSKKVNNLRYAEYYDMQDTFDDLYAKALKRKTFSQLIDLILSPDNILLAYRNIKKNSGSVTPGTDGLKISDVEKYSPENLVRKVRNITNNYNPRAVRRKEIPKPYDPSKMRPLGIPCIWDRLLQQCILQILEPICEARFSENSYGFRPNRSCENAVAHLEKLMQLSKLHYVVEVDIKGFFDNVNHSKLIKQIWVLGIHDKKLIYVIKRILRAPIRLENGTEIIPKAGTPQGGILSPLLANIVLNELDKWIESQWQENPVTKKYKSRRKNNGAIDKGHAYQAMKTTNLKEMFIVRYADDFRIMCRNKNAAYKTMEAVKQWLKERLKLNVSAEKTKVVNLKRQYSNFLGIKIKLVEKRNKLVVRSHVCDKAIERIKTVAKKKIKNIPRLSKGQTEASAILDYNAFVMGEHNYYKMATHVSLDFAKIGYEVGKTMRRFRGKLKREPKAKAEVCIIPGKYGSSDQLRWLGNKPILPIGYIQTKTPLHKKKVIQKYTPEGRKEIHSNLEMDLSMLKAMLRQRLNNKSSELADNRLSLFCAQLGKCVVTGLKFENLEDIHCHHKKPCYMGGKDNYQNLILVHEYVHTLIHATNEITINKYLSEISLNEKQLEKLNRLRKQAGNLPI